jgi:hypothetical protein
VAFSTTERAAVMARVRYELGYSALTTAGEPHFPIVYAPEKAIDSLYSGASTTSVTAVTSTTVPTTIVLADGAGFATGVRIHVDAGSRREIVTPQYVSGASLSALFTKPHAATYSVEVESGESMLRTLLAKLDDITALIQSNFGTGGLKSVDEIEFFESGGHLSSLTAERERWREELASLLKLPYRGSRGGGSGRLEAY